MCLKKIIGPGIGEGLFMGDTKKFSIVWTAISLLKDLSREQPASQVPHACNSNTGRWPRKSLETLTKQMYILMGYLLQISNVCVHGGTEKNCLVKYIARNSQDRGVFRRTMPGHQVLYLLKKGMDLSGGLCCIWSPAQNSIYLCAYYWPDGRVGAHQ